MGRYLSCGLAYEISINSRYYDESKDEMLKRIGKNIDLNLYNRYDTEDYIFLRIKEDIFEKHALQFVIEQSKLFGKYYKRYAEEELPTLENLNYKELIEAAKEQRVLSFQFVRGDGYYNDISYLDPEGKCEICCDLIYFIGDGSAFFEGYYEISMYLRNCIMQASKNPIKGATVVTITV